MRSLIEPSLCANTLFSFGNKAVFLLGSETKDEVPVALYVKSGDVMIMGGRSRKCYHGMFTSLHFNCLRVYLQGIPRIFAGTCPPLQLKAEPTIDEQFALDFLKDMRININIRQVLLHANKQ